MLSARTAAVTAFNRYHHKLWTDRGMAPMAGKIEKPVSKRQIHPGCRNKLGLRRTYALTSVPRDQILGGEERTNSSAQRTTLIFYVCMVTHM